MATPAEVLDLFAQVRDGSAIDRARAATQAFRALASLEAGDRRRLAVLVAERAAPELVPRIQAETGLDLSREQVQAVIDMAGRLDADDIDELQAVVQDERARDEAIRSVSTAAAAATGLDDVLPPPSDELLEDQPPPPPAPPAPPEADAVDTAVDEAVLDELGVEAERLELDPEPEPQYEPPPAPEPEPFVSIFDTLPDTPTRTPEAEPARRRRHVTTLPAPAPAPDLTDRVRAARQPLVEQLRAATSNAARLRLVRSHHDDLRDMDALQRTAVVEAVPDGWARRRVLDVLAREGIVGTDELATLVPRLASPMSRSWVCATAVEAGVLGVDAAAELLDDRAANRLRRRYG